VVDDPLVVRRLVGNVLTEDPSIEVVGTAANGLIALAKLESLAPDVVTMDVEMPEMDGVSAVREMRPTGHTMPVIMFSTLTDRGAAATLDALSAGATDTSPSPPTWAASASRWTRCGPPSSPRSRHSCLVAGRPPRSPPARRAGRARHAATTAGRFATSPAVVSLAPLVSPRGGYQVLVICCSTGGPDALSRLLAALPPLPVPVAVVQHMPALFTAQFAARLDRQLASPVAEAVAGQRLEPGIVTIAPGRLPPAPDRHPRRAAFQ
jgi:two-component system, chemotaxis family, protein-glutamate methylesterase/glutaminase